MLVGEHLYNRETLFVSLQSLETNDNSLYCVLKLHNNACIGPYNLPYNIDMRKMFYRHTDLLAFQHAQTAHDYCLQDVRELLFNFYLPANRRTFYQKTSTLGWFCSNLYE